MLGGFFEIKIDNRYANDLLKSNIARLVAGGSPLEIVHIKKIEEQIVSGSNYRFTGTFKKGGAETECVVKIFDQPWTGKIKLEADCGGEKIVSAR